MKILVRSGCKVAWLLLLWLLEDLGCCYFDLACKNSDDAGKNGRLHKNKRRRNHSIISPASARSSSLFLQVFISTHAGKSEILYWVLQLDCNGFNDANMVVK